MANKTVTGTTLGNSVTVTNAIGTNGAPSTMGASVTITTSPGVLVQSGTGGYLGVDLGAGNDVLQAFNMPWANSESSNAFDSISMGDGEDLVQLERTGVRNALDMGAGNDTLELTNTYARQTEMGSGNDLTRFESDVSGLSNEELAAKSSAASNMMTLSGGLGSDTLDLVGNWTLSLNNANGAFTVDTNGTVAGGTVTMSVLNSDQMTQVVGMPTVLSGTVSYGTLTLTNGTTVAQNFAFQNYEDVNAVCFTAGTMIETPKGAVAIETLKVGDLVTTRHGEKPLKWLGKRRLDVIDLMGNPKLLPVVIPAGSFGNGLPRRKLALSPQHRVLVRSALAKRMFGAQEVLIPAKSLIGHNGTATDGATREVTYIHLMFDEHTTVLAEGLAAETLFLGAQSLQMLSADSLSELRAIFGDLETLSGQTTSGCLPFIKGRDARALVARHAKSAQVLLS